MKNITVIMSGTNARHDLAIEPGTTGQDVLRQLNLDGYFLTRQQGTQGINPTENLYSLLADGEKIEANSQMTVGEAREEVVACRW